MRRLLLPTIALALALTGCATATPSSAPPKPETSLVPAAATRPIVVLEVQRSGGWCVEGMCAHAHLKVWSDGTWKVRTPSPDGTWKIRSGTLSTVQRDDLAVALRTTGLDQDPRPAESCASWVDGVDVLVQWRAVEQRQASSCDYAFEEADPLLRFAARFTNA